MKKLYLNCITAALLFMLLTKTGWGQTTIVTDGFDNGSTLFTFSGGIYSYYQGNSSTSDRPVSSPFVFDGTHSLGVNNSTVTLTSMDVNTTGYSNIQMILKIAAFSKNSSTNGLDADDYIRIEISPDGGTNYYNTIEIHGNSDAYWAYSTGTGNAITPYGTYANFAPIGGGNRTTDGYSNVTITNIPTTSNLKIKITISNNNLNELWIVDAFRIFTEPQFLPEPTILLFSEYVESSTNNNQVIELYNGSTNTINLAQYVIVRFRDGASRVTGTRYTLGFQNPTNLLPGETFVIVKNTASQDLIELADLVTLNLVMSFDGNDPLAIYFANDVSGTTISSSAVEIDIFGEIGYVGSGWGSGSTSTVNNTLRRKNTVYSPLNTNPSPFIPSNEYDFFGSDNYLGLGFHDFGGTITTTNTFLPNRTYSSLIVDGGTTTITVNFTGSSIIKGNFLIKRGRVKLSNNTLTLDGNFSILGEAGISRMLVLDDGVQVGTLKQKISNNGTYNFYIGDTRVTTEYSPATVTFSGATFNDAYLTVQMKNERHPDNLSQTDFLKRYWTFSSTGITDLNYGIELKYTEDDVSGTEQSIYFGKYDGSIWENLGQPDYGSNKFYKVGLTSFSSFTGGIESAMPVRIASFNASVYGRNVQLNWITENEENNFGFEIEKSIINNEQTKWIKIGFVSGKGNCSEPMNYSFEDRNLTSGTYKYRLKQVDYNGNFDYYELDYEVIIGVPKKFDLGQNYPNPFNPLTKINFDLPQKSFAKLVIYEITGKEIAVLVNENKDEGYHTVVFDAKNLASGIYFYRLYAGNFISTRKMVLIR